MNLTMEPPTASSPGSSSPGRGRAAAEPSAIDNTMASTITAGSTRFLFFSTAMVSKTLDSISGHVSLLGVN
jgi:hypothetical protein